MNPPPFLISFPDKQALKAALAEEVISQHWDDLERLVDSNLPPAVSVRVIACLFGYSPSFVGAMLRRPQRYYRTFQIRKGKKKRDIQAPRVSLKVIQSWLGHHLASALDFGDAIYGFIPGRSAALAAKAHCGARWVHSFDLKNFFQTTSEMTVSKALMETGYPHHAASLISSLCCYGGFLAQGSPASPVLSNMAFLQTDGLLKQIAVELGACYTRYADDLVFSGTGTVPELLAPRVRDVISRTDWTLSPEKEHLAQWPKCLKVHGLLVHGLKPRLTKKYRNQIRAFAHLSAHGKIRTEDLARLRGHLAYADSVKALDT